MTRRIFWMEVSLIILSIIVTMVFYPTLPDTIPTHWDGSFQANGYSPKWMIFVFGPGLLSAIFAFTYVGPWISPSKFSVEGFRATYDQLMFALFCVVVYCGSVALWFDAGHTFEVGRYILGGICILLVVLGNQMSKMRRNFILGIRTPWTITSERVWYATHRFAAKTFITSGLGALALTVCGVSSWPFYVIFVGVFSPVVYSLVVYKRFEQRGEV